MQPLQASDSLAWHSGVSYWGANWHSILTQILAFWHASSKGLQEAFTGCSKIQDLSKCIVATVQTHIYPYMVIHSLTRATRQAYIPLKKSVITMTNLTFACARACLRVDKWWLFFFKKGRKGVETTSLDELSRLAKVCGLKSKNFGSYMPKCSPEVQLGGGD